MIPANLLDKDIAGLSLDMRRCEEPFAIATVIRTAGSTAAKPGSKALLNADGVIVDGWIGGGCVRSALAKAVDRALTEGQPQLISLHPQELLDNKGVNAGDEVDGVRFARNGCPSKGSIDIFIEAVLPQPELVLFGDSPVAQSLTQLAKRFEWAVTPGAAPDLPRNTGKGRLRVVVVATQGKEDLASLRAALELSAGFVGFVGSRKKYANLKTRLLDQGVSNDVLSRVQAPVGLAINAVTPDEIALSILAQLTSLRRRNLRQDMNPDA